MIECFIIFELSDGDKEKIPFINKERRDSMLDMLDKYLVSFDNGTIIAPDIPNLPSFLLGGQGGVEGPGGMSIQ